MLTLHSACRLDLLQLRDRLALRHLDIARAACARIVCIEAYACLVACDNRSENVQGEVIQFFDLRKKARNVRNLVESLDIESRVDASRTIHTFDLHVAEHEHACNACVICASRELRQGILYRIVRSVFVRLVCLARADSSLKARLIVKRLARYDMRRR